jgi:hypothetical protein
MSEFGLMAVARWVESYSEAKPRSPSHAEFLRANSLTTSVDTLGPDAGVVAQLTSDLCSWSMLVSLPCRAFEATLRKRLQ